MTYYARVAGALCATACAAIASAQVGTTIITTRGTPTGSHANTISVLTDGQGEAATVTTNAGDTETQRMQARALAISTQMTRCSAAASSETDSDALTITALGTRNITGISHNSWDGEQINVNPQSTLATGIVFHCSGTLGQAGESCTLAFPQLNVNVTVPVSAGMPPQAMSAIMFIRLNALGLTGGPTSDGFTLDPIAIGGAPGAGVDPFTLGATLTYTGSSYNVSIDYAWVIPPGCGSADFNCDGDTGTDQDIEAFFSCLAGTCPAAPCTSTADFNGDGDVGTDADIEAFFRVLAGGTC